jgi:hypothetical protein
VKRGTALCLTSFLLLWLGACSSIDQLFGCPAPDMETETAIHGQLAANDILAPGADTPDAGPVEASQDLQALADGDSLAPDDSSPTGFCNL